MLELVGGQRHPVLPDGIEPVAVFFNGLQLLISEMSFNGWVIVEGSHAQIFLSELIYVSRVHGY